MDNPKTSIRPTYEISIDEEGSFKLPPELRSSLGLQNGDTLTLIQGEGEIWVMPTRLITPELANQMEDLMTEKNLSADDLLDGLVVERERLFKEQYGDLAAN